MIHKMIDSSTTSVRPLTLVVNTSNETQPQITSPKGAELHPVNEPLTLVVNISNEKQPQTASPKGAELPPVNGPLTLVVNTPNELQITSPMNLCLNKVLNLNIIGDPSSLTPTLPSDHMCYILRSMISNRTYIGYTIDFPHRLRQHNGELMGGAKRTKKWRPWVPVCLIKGFYESSSALRFEYRLQRPKRRRKAGEDMVQFTLRTLVDLINNGDGSIEKQSKRAWPSLQITWYDRKYNIQHPNIANFYISYRLD